MRQIPAIGGLLALPFIFRAANVGKGATAWVGFGGFSMQPSELVKIAYLFVLAYFLSRRKVVLALGFTGVMLGWREKVNRAFSPIISGWLQVQYGFAPPFIGTITLYIISVILYYFFFLRRREKNEPCKPRNL